MTRHQILPQKDERGPHNTDARLSGSLGALCARPLHGVRRASAALALLLTAACAAGPSTSGAKVPSVVDQADPYALADIQSGNWSAAEDYLTSGDQNDPLLLLNLAYVYDRQGRVSDAEKAYRKILSGKANPYATMAGGQPRRVKSVAQQALLNLDH